VPLPVGSQDTHGAVGYARSVVAPSARPICTKDGSKRVIPCKDVSFGGVNDVPLNFGSAFGGL